MKYILFLLSTIIAIAASGQRTAVDQFETFDEMADRYMDKDDGVTYVINFWATWCGPCVKELPYFEQLLAKHKSDKLKVLLVSLDFPKNVESKLLPFLNKNNIQSEVVLLNDPKTNVWIDKVDPKWEGAIPVTIIYKGDNKVFWDGEFENYEDLEKLFFTIYLN